MRCQSFAVGAVFAILYGLDEELLLKASALCACGVTERRSLADNTAAKYNPSLAL